ncbi:flavin monoamine oxidase family protein [Hoeflea prorocentri]|uniref:FAD-dependent oxidoreductase n=1 Tax=Hoeflea prorocentri TaxID=1922333 RepID=A0A9X3UE80_9HYPH|nr:FAD-dependent oxidoreductase [Hoeflea prorocentri]MCY6379788.1 FAD-dependent oxidoreductase [Hoeflea prorocentri]MDA5397588.1 FAD-dependent oxidoreductase [Hoeflea prorocentri]
MDTDVAIIGAGLSGLALARRMEQAGTDYVVIEARERIGGRIKTLEYKGARFDLGPSWFWPGQPRMAELVRSLGLAVFDQYAEGDLTYEDEAGRVQRGVGYASMEGSYRLEGGMSALIAGLAAGLADERILTGNAAMSLSLAKGVMLASGGTIRAERYVLALPPRVAAGLVFEPQLSDAQMSTLRSVPTWMAGQAKFVAVYERPFWRQDGLSGDAMSRQGPLVETHDASSPQAGPGALFGFVGVPVQIRQSRQADLKAAALQQLVRLFGNEAGNPLQTALQDWAFETETAAELDHQALSSHPQYGLSPELAGLWGGRLMLCVSETAAEFGGYLEGALAAAETTAMLLEKEIQ